MMSNNHRLPRLPGEWIDRAHSIEFEFEGKHFQGFAGDTISSALWASGQRVLGRSFKYHRPRGIFSLANHDVNGMMQWGQKLNVRADVTLLEMGMQLSAVNTFGGLNKDPAKVLNHLSRFLPVGFYYKAFHGKRLFPRWERVFRTLAGLGKVNLSTPRLLTPKDYAFCAVLIVGAGPSGLAAALAAADQGADVVIVDENAQAGGSGGYQIGGELAKREATEALLVRVIAHPRIRLLTGIYAAGYYTDHWIALVDDKKMTKLRAEAVVIAAGSFEQPAVFRNNDLPGVVLGSAAQRLIYRYAVRPMQRAVVLCANADGYRVALDLIVHGVMVAAIVDLRAHHQPCDAEVELAAKGVEMHTGTCIVEALPTPGCSGVAGARIAAFANGVADAATARDIPCDGIVMSVGWAPAANLLYQAGTHMRYDDLVEQFVPDALPPGVFACGRVNGVYDFKARLLDGERAGSAAAAHVGFGEKRSVSVPVELESSSFPWPIVAHPQGKNFVDFDEDLQLKDFENAVQEGFDNIELLKRFTTNGMGPSQGKHSNMNALRILARLVDKHPREVGTTTARPFFHPVPMALLAGRGFHPVRRTPMHLRHAAMGAYFMSAGDWQRPEYYARQHKDRLECIREEVDMVRHGVGIIDVGTLGKLEIIGPQAAEFLERVYVSRYANLKIGMTRYAVMCDETGVVVDDGVVARLAEDHFYFTTTTSGATAIYRELSRLNTQWQMACGIINHTGAFAAINLAGPQSRKVLARVTTLDLSAAAFPYLAIREGKVAGIPARLMRVGFVGEWGYEIHVPAEDGVALWDALVAAGSPFGIRPFGVEAQRLLRLEKGHVIIGQDTDGLTTPFEAGLGWAVKMDKPFFIGQRSLQIVDKQPQRQRLVGFRLDQAHGGPAPQECHLVIHDGAISGRITSIGWSHILCAYIGLAMVTPELAKPDQTFEIRITDGSLVVARVTPTPFYDPEQRQQKEEA
ncbi:2Fe-2S iron-sulfur cluster-binding protein [Acidithiobacillus sulfuriphilus]|uniref:2Fe-2S iron-sulfur cluster-binding protein n=2 Tax=Acidithiobacillus sulfuriphilus TaxID=1867749 RepID=A0ACD5HR05_9PROT|nr:2Fe-2S iron-sulfur cluster-binding protein [Acidithiobacillus sulfuriphilus]